MWPACLPTVYRRLPVTGSTRSHLVEAGGAVPAIAQRRSMIEWRFFDLEAPLYGDALLPKDGRLAVPQGSGLGLEPDADVLREYRRR